MDNKKIALSLLASSLVATNSQAGMFDFLNIFGNDEKPAERHVPKQPKEHQKQAVQKQDPFAKKAIEQKAIKEKVKPNKPASVDEIITSTKKENSVQTAPKKVTKIIAKKIVKKPVIKKLHKPIKKVEEKSDFYVKESSSDFEIVYDPITKKPIGVIKKGEKKEVVPEMPVKIEKQEVKKPLTMVSSDEYYVKDSSDYKVVQDPETNTIAVVKNDVPVKIEQKPVLEIKKDVTPIPEVKKVIEEKKPETLSLKEDLLPAQPSELKKVVKKEEPKKEFITTVITKPVEIKPTVPEKEIVAVKPSTNLPKASEELKSEALLQKEIIAVVKPTVVPQKIKEEIRINSKEEVYLIKTGDKFSLKFKNKDKFETVALTNEMNSFTGKILSGKSGDWDAKMFMFNKNQLIYNVFINNYNTSISGTYEEQNLKPIQQSYIN